MGGIQINKILNQNVGEHIIKGRLDVYKNCDSVMLMKESCVDVRGENG